MAQGLVGYNPVRGVKELYRLRRPLSKDSVSVQHPPFPPDSWSSSFPSQVLAAFDLLEQFIHTCLDVLTPDIEWHSDARCPTQEASDSPVPNNGDSPIEYSQSPLDFFRYPNDAAGMSSPNCFPHIDRGVRAQFHSFDAA